MRLNLVESFVCLPATRTPYSTTAATPSESNALRFSLSESPLINPAYCLMTEALLSISRSKSALILKIFLMNLMI